jgi:hypothetical protein
MPWTGLAIDLDGSVDRLFRLDELGAAYLDGLLPSVRRENEGRAQSNHSVLLKRLCVLTVELSGARAGAWAWYFILHASARTIC